jgi:hypothetical protein
MMTSIEWPDLVAIMIVSTPSIIAAISSLRNGKKLDQSRRENGRAGAIKPDPEVRPKNTGLPRDWFKP